MKTIIGAFALILAVPAIGQVAPAADPHAHHKAMDHSQHHAAGQQEHHDHAKHMEAMHKHCQEMMKHHGKDHDAKSGGASAPNVGSHEGHSAH